MTPPDLRQQAEALLTYDVMMFPDASSWEAQREAILAVLTPLLTQTEREHARLMLERDSAKEQFDRHVEWAAGQAQTERPEAQGAQTPTHGKPLQYWCDECEAVTFHDCRRAAPADPGGGA